MFCKNCGAETVDGARFCVGCGADLTPAPEQSVCEEPIQAPVCGEPIQEPAYEEPVQEAPVQEAPVQEAPAEGGFEQTLNNVKEGATEVLNKAADFGKAYVEEAKKDKKKLIIPVVAAVVVIALVVVLVSLLSVKPYKSALDNVFNIANGKITEKNVEKLYPQEYWDEKDLDPDEATEMLEELFDDNWDDLEDEFGDNVKITYKVTDADKLDKEDLDDLRDEIHEEYGVKRKDVKEAYELELEITIKGSEDKDTDDAEDIVVAKIGNKWYVVKGLSVDLS